MEEKKKDVRWERLDSSELAIRGGISLDWIVKIAGIAAMLLSIIRDYLPSFAKGYNAGKK